MKGLAISYKGIEDISAKEISELIKAKTEIKESCVIFDVDKLEDLALLCYKGQSVNRVLLLLDKFKISQVEDLKKISKIDFSRWLRNKTFAVRCEIVNNESLISQEIEKATGDEIKGKVDLENPDVTVFVYVYRDNVYVGIDFGGDLSKRDYKIFISQMSLKGTIAYALVRIGDYSKEKKVLDPFCGSGEIIIEAALFGTGFPLNFFNKQKFPFLKFKEFDFDKIDKEIGKEKLMINAFDTEQRRVKSAEKNAKIAGVNKFINFSRQDIAYLELKFKEKDVDLIVTNIPRKSNQVSVIKMEKLYEEFFYQAAYILKKNGRIVICCKDDSLLKAKAEKTKFKVSEEREIVHGGEVLKVIVFGK
ncbi:methyltransferase domain-containing protein [Candidatus Woesearchaeota archaeon]|nr:methyltransferase domain-containing protein [Candidatus Woesearchaeota archaeon]